MVGRRKIETIREGKYLSENMETLNFYWQTLPIWEVFAYSILVLVPQLPGPSSSSPSKVKTMCITHVLFCGPFYGLWIAEWPAKSIQASRSCSHLANSLAILC